MIPHIPNQRQHKSNAGKPFSDLVSYIEENKSQEKQLGLSSEFTNILDYATSPLDKSTNEEKCIAIRTHGVTDLTSAAIEMNAVSKQNKRCKDPAYHFILSWPEHEHPAPEAIFDAAEHAIKALGLADHQYILAVHGNTDNMHCHVAVNRIHPETYKSRNIEWAKKTLHLAARESELKHGWSHDNGIYVIAIDGHGRKSIVLNKEIAQNTPHAHAEQQEKEALLPTWHDPESLDSWLKSKISRALKRALPGLGNWNALHNWLADHDITLTDSGGGGMRLHATSQETGEVIDLPASKGLRFLKRSELETRWGAFTPAVPRQPTPCIVPDLSHLTHNQIAKGVNHVLRSSLDHGIPPDHIVHADANRRRQATQRTGGLHELSAGGLDDGRQDGEVLLPDSLHDYLGNQQAGQDKDLRRPGASQTGSRRSLTRDNSKREERKDQRAAARADLRNRFAQYKRFVRLGDRESFDHAKDINSQRSLALKTIREDARAAKSAVGKNRSLARPTRLHTIIGIDAESLRRKLQVEAAYQEKAKTLRATRLPPLGWREWLHEQSNLGDQAALSALRGIVYQAQRDAKRDSAKEIEEQEKETNAANYREQQYRKLMERLLEEERKEIAIRGHRIDAMRPYEADALLARYIGIQWRVTGNGNIEYSDRDGEHLFTDRGNRVTFDRARVTDEEISLALVHAQQKYGTPLTLTGDDPAFTERMARLADDMGMEILNPEQQMVIANHRSSRALEIKQTAPTSPARESLLQDQEPKLVDQTPQEEPAQPIQTPQERLRAKVLSIDPRAEFVTPDADGHHLYTGPVAATMEILDGAALGFAQHIGRGVYAIHPINAPEDHNDAVIEVQYRNGQPSATIPSRQKGKEGKDNP